MTEQNSHPTEERDSLRSYLSFRSPQIFIGVLCYRFYKVTFFVSALLIVVSFLSAQRFLRLDTDWLVLFSAERPEIRALRHWREQLPGSKDMAVILSGGTIEERQMAAAELGAAFEREKELLEAPLAAIDTSPFVKSGLFFLAPDQLERLDDDTKLVIGATSLLELADAPNMLRLTEMLAANPDGSEILARGLEAFVEATKVRQDRSRSESLVPKLAPESEELTQYVGDFEKIPEKAFLSLDGGRTLLVLVRPRIGNQALEAAAPAVETVRGIVDRTRERYLNVALSLTGEPVLVVDERQTIAKDSFRCTVASLVLVAILFHFGFKEYLRPCLAIFCLAVGLGWTLGVVSVCIGHLNFITITYVPILVGIGLDFGIHMSFRFYEHREHHPPMEALVQALRGSGKDTFFGALTTSAVFAVLWLVGFRGVSELGAIALCGVMLCQLSSCTFLPACFAFLEECDKCLPQSGRQELTEVGSNLCRYDKPLLIGTGVALIGSLFFAPKVGFSVHLLKMQSPKLESVKTELRLVAEGKSSVLTAMISTPSLEEARRLEVELREMPSVGEVISLATFLPQVTPEKTQRVTEVLGRRERLMELLSYVTRTPPATTKEALAIMERFNQLALPPAREREVKEAVAELERQLEERGPGPVMDAFESLRQETQQSLLALKPLLLQQSNRPLAASDLPHGLTDRLRLLNGDYALRVFPKVDIWQPKNLHQFLNEIRSVAPNVSGEPVLIELFERLVLKTHWYGLALSLLAIFAVLVAVLRSFNDVIMAALPTAMSLLLVLGTMGLLGWDFNPANFVAVPMLLGIGSVFGLHSVMRMNELGHDKLLSCSTGPAIVLSAATSIAAFAALGLSEHRGIASLGWVVALGLTFNAVLSIAVLPAWQRRRRSACTGHVQAATLPNS